MNNDYKEMMSKSPLIKCDNTTKLKHGQLIGFKAFGEEREITAAYPVWSQIGNEVQFVLYTKENGRPCIDNDWIRDTGNFMYTNDPAIIVDIPVKTPTTFQNEITNFFNRRTVL